MNGYRIELGEIENIVQSDPDVVSSVCCVKDKTLVVYLVIHKSPGSLTGERIRTSSTILDLSDIASRLRQICQDELPSYMLPQAFVQVDEIPLSSNGKVDRKKLRPPTTAERMLASSMSSHLGRNGEYEDGSHLSFVAPSSQIEQKVAEIYASVLNLDQAAISMNHNFFDLGGDSLAALRLLSKVQSEFRISLGVPTLFEAPTVAQFTKEILERMVEMDTDGGGSRDKTNNQGFSRRQQLEIVCLQKGSLGWAPILLVHAAGSSVMHYRELVSSLDPKQPVLAVEDKSLQSDTLFPFSFDSINDVADAILELIIGENILGLYGENALNSRGKAAREQTMFVGGWSYGGVVALEVAARLEASGFSVPSIFLLDAPVRTIQTVSVEGVQPKSRASDLPSRAERLGPVNSAGAIHFDNCTRLLQKHICSDHMVESDIVTILAEKSNYGIASAEISKCTTGDVSEYVLKDATHWNTCTDAFSTEVGSILSLKIEQHRFALNFVRASVPVFLEEDYQMELSRELSNIFM